MNDYDVRIVSSMEKIMPKGGPLKERQIQRITGFQGQRVSFQVAYCFHGNYYVTMMFFSQYPMQSDCTFCAFSPIMKAVRKLITEFLVQVVQQKKYSIL